MATVMKDIVTWLKQWFYTEDEIDTTVQGLQSQINNKADSTTVSGLSTTVGTKADKTGGVQQITDTNAHSNLGTSANATQSAINTAIDTMIGNLISTELIVVVSSLPTASSTTMNKIYCLTGGSESTNKFTEYLTVKDGSNYTWEKIGEISSGSLTVDWSDILNKPDTYTPSAHTHDDRYYTETEVDTALGGKAPTDHSSTATTYGVGNSTKYGHVKVVDNLTTNSFSATAPIVLSAKQGYLLQLNKSAKSETIDIDNIELADKGETNEGCIIFNTIS